MFSQLFERPHAIQHQLNGPLLEPRLRYLAHCAQQGVARTTLRKIAYYQLIIIEYLNLTAEGIITPSQIETAAQRWSHRQPKPPEMKGTHSPVSKARFIRDATQWLCFLERLQPSIAPLHPFETTASEFAHYMREQRGLSEETISYRCNVIKNFLNKVCEQPQQLAHLTIRQIDTALIERINQGGYSRRTIQTQASSLRAFFKFAESQGWCQSGLAQAIRAPRVFHHETLPFSPTWEEVQRLLTTVEGNQPVDIRDRAIMLLLAVYGMRSGEVRRLQLDNINWEKELIQLQRVKQGQSQQFPLVAVVGEAIVRYLKEVRPHCLQRELFLTLRAPLRPLGKSAIFQIVNRRLLPLGIAIKHHGPHSLRHACATRLINQGISLKEIGDQLGHRDLETTRIYAKVDLRSLRQVADFNLGGLL
ncbi:MAG: phage integrase [bacterium]|nr:MAG: phage integrase [bacterium]